MYAGSDSTDAQNYTQWALNPSSYQNMSNEQVDWAALAQQWIIMKEAGPPVPEQITNPSIAAARKKETSNEGGEAPMEVENDTDDNTPLQWNDGGGSGDSWNWTGQQQWNWNNTWSAPPGVPPPNTPKPPLLPTPPSYNQFSNSDNCNDNGNYNFNPTSTSEYTNNYWAAGSSKVIKPHNKRYSKVNVPTTIGTTKPINIDAAKRKQLPAWIREGLEKMERDKIKQIDRQRENQEKAEYQAKLKLSEKNALEILKDTVKEQQLKSKFESDNEESGTDTDGRPLTPEDTSLPQEDLMVKVRRTMTEILLKVTNREIYNICKEEIQRHQKKSKASDQRTSAPSGANLSAKLGLGDYGGSESSSDSSDESTKEQYSSDTELKDTINRRKMEFLKTEREIEVKLADAERQDKPSVGGSKAPSPAQSDNDSQVDAKILDAAKNSSRERTPPLKTIARRKSRKSSTSSSSSDSDVSDERSKAKRNRRRSSSSLSSDSDNKYKRDSDSRTPEQKRKYGSSYAESGDKKRKYVENKLESQSRRSRSRSSGRRRRSRSSSHKRNERSSSRTRYRRSRTRSRSRSHYRRSSHDRTRRSSSRRSRRSSSYSRSRRRSSSRRSRSRTRQRQRRSRSYSSGRGKRSHRY